MDILKARAVWKSRDMKWEVEGRCEVKLWSVCTGGEVDTYPGELDVDDKYPTGYVRMSPASASRHRRARYFDISDTVAELIVTKFPCRHPAQ